MKQDTKQDKSVPPIFHKSNLAKTNHVIHLAELAKNWCDKNKVTVNTTEFLEKTKIVDIDGKGISHSTLHKNETVHELFKSVQTPLKTRSKLNNNPRSSKSKNAGEKNLKEKYADDSRIDILTKYENLIEENKNLEVKIQKLISERDNLKLQRDNQLVELSKKGVTG
jgi:flagellar basal body rod protein FlgG